MFSGVVGVIQGQRRVGLGFLVADLRAVTAAHVVNIALGRAASEPARPSNARVTISFPLLQDGIIRVADVVSWGPADAEPTDVCVLELLEPTPQSLPDLVLASPTVGDEVYIFGPTSTGADGWVRAAVMGNTAHDRFQMDQSVNGVFRAKSGWSGGPVVCGSKVVGIIVAKPAGDADRADVYGVGGDLIRRHVEIAERERHMQHARPVPDRSIFDRLARIEARLDEMVGRLMSVADDMRRVERLAVLPNYKIPSVARLATMSDLPRQLDGTRVLLRLDVDIAGELPAESHFKIDRAARSIRELAERGASVLLLASQGMSSVELLEPVTRQTLQWHTERLRDALSDLGPVQVVSSLSALDGEPVNATVTMLPPISEIGNDETFREISIDAQRRLTKASIDELCRESKLVTQLAPYYDVFVLDDFRNCAYALPSNVGLAAGKDAVIGRGIEEELLSLERMVTKCIDLGQVGVSRRVSICGSSRPDDIAVVETLLQYRLFDECLLGVFPTLTILAARGVDLGESLGTMVSRLAERNGARFEDVVRGPGVALSTTFADSVTLAKDIVFLDRGNRVVVDTSHPTFSSLGRGAKPVAIGPDTVAQFTDRVIEADLVFHFGMLSSAAAPENGATKAVIDAYCRNAQASFMAGDHILELAADLSLFGLLEGTVTGAKTTSSYVTNRQLPGLAPFLRGSAAREESTLREGL